MCIFNWSTLYILIFICAHAYSFKVVGIGRSNIRLFSSSSSSLSRTVGAVRKGLNDSLHHFSSTRSFLVTVENWTQYRHVTSFKVRSLLKAKTYVTGCVACACQQRKQKYKTQLPFWLFLFWYLFMTSQVSSVSTMSDYGLDDWGSILGIDKGFFFCPLHPDQLWWPSSLLSVNLRSFLQR